MTEMRKDRRAPASLKVKYKSATVDEFIEQFGTDVSRGGIFIKTKKPLEAGALLKFEFQLQDGSPVLNGVGRVAWRRLEQHSRPDLPAGMGIKFFKLSDHSRVVVERIESRNAGSKSRYEQTDDAEFAPPLSTNPPAADSGAKPLPANGRRSLGASSGSGSGPNPVTMPPPPAVSSIPPALADVPPARPPVPAPRPRSRPISSGLPKGALGGGGGSFFPEKAPRTSGSPSRSGRDASDFLASAFQAGGAGPDVRDRARRDPQSADRARRDPQSVDLARELFGDLGGESASTEEVEASAAADGIPTPVPDAVAIPTPVPSTDVPRSKSPLSDRIPSIEQLVEDASKPEPASTSQRSAARESAKAAPRPATPLPAASASGRAGKTPSLNAPLTLAISVPSNQSATTIPPESGGRSRLLLFAALACTIVLGGAGAYIAMQRGMFGGGAQQAAAPPATDPTPTPSAATSPDPAPGDSTGPQPTAAAEPTPAAPAPEPGPEVAVAIQSKPRGAEVTAGGKPAGVTPLVLKLPSNVPVEIAVKRAGFATMTRSVTPADGAPAETFELAPLSYQVVIQTDPPGATVATRSKSVVSPEPLDLGPIQGPVAINIELEGYLRVSRTVRLDEFQERDGSMRAEITVPLTAAPARRRVKALAPATVPDAPPPEPGAEPAAPPVMQVKPEGEAAPPPTPAPEANAPSAGNPQTAAAPEAPSE